MKNCSVVALFCTEKSIYKSILSECFDIRRDARLYAGSLPVVAHPPCRAWGRLSQFSKPRTDEKALAFFAVDTVRRVGGVLEHPSSSALWPAAGLPLPGVIDCFGGFTFPILQSWFGHRAPKSTFLYICGVSPLKLPDVPFALGIPDGRIEFMGRQERERTPVDLARWLVAVASMCRGAV